MEALVWAGSHMDELGPLRIIKYLARHKILGVTTGIVDINAKPGQREPNMNRFYGPKFTIEDREHPKSIRAEEVLIINNNPKVGIAIDMHNTMLGCIDNAWINLDIVDPQKFTVMLRFLKMVGIHRIIDFSDYNSMLSYSPSAFMLEIDREGKLNQPSYWRRPLKRLVAEDLPIATTADFSWYRYATDVPIKWLKERDLPEYVQPFEKLSPQVTKAMGFPDQEMVALSWQPKGNWLGEAACIVDPPPDILPTRRLAPYPYLSPIL